MGSSRSFGGIACHQLAKKSVIPDRHGILSFGNRSEQWKAGIRARSHQVPLCRPQMSNYMAGDPPNLDDKGEKQDADIHSEMLTQEAEAASLAGPHCWSWLVLEQVELLYGKLG